MFYQLPEEIIRVIFEYCMDKREKWDRVNKQFLKGSFIRDVAMMIPKTHNQRERWLQRWLSYHSVINKRFTQWDALRPSMNNDCVGTNNNLSIIAEWSIKTAQATCGNYRNGVLRNTISSGANPVTEWLENIKGFEKEFPSYSREPAG